MMTTTQTPPVATSASPAVLLTGALWLASYFAARYVLGTWPMGEPWDILVLCVPIFAFYGFVWAVQATLRRADELQRRIHLEAFVLAFLTTMLTAMGLGLLEESPRVGVLLPWRHAWIAMPVIYAVCYWIARRRYR